MSLLRLLALTLVLVAASAATASAATVEVRLVHVPTSYGGYSVWRIVFAAAPGERNDLRLRALDEHTVRVADAGAPVQSGERCRGVDEHTAECAIPRDHPHVPGLSPYLYIAAVTLGDGDDAAQVEGDGLPLMRANGGPGSDVLTGSDTGGDQLDGGGGRDRLSGRGNGDTLTDGDTPGAVDADVLDGGEDGGDTVSYAGRTAAVTVDLADPGPDGEPGEADTVRGVENATGGAGDYDLGGAGGMSMIDGGAGDDHLDGEAGEDTLAGGPGDDRLHGHAGDDFLDGGAGNDRLRGDAGRDVFTGATTNDVVSCGAGHDAIGNPAGAFAGLACEQLAFSYDDSTGLEAVPHPTLAPDGRALVFAIGCPRPDELDGECGAADGRLVVTVPGGRWIGRGVIKRGNFVSDSRPSRATVRVPLGPRARRLARPGRTVRVSLRGRGLPTAVWGAPVRRARR
jgi:hypothetical protein